MNDFSETNRTSFDGTSLVLRLREQDPEAWKQLVELFGPLIFHWCKLCRLDESDSSDVMQEVFSAASRNVITFRRQSGGTLRGWLWTITQNKIRDHFRKQSGRDLAAGGTEAHQMMAAIPGESTSVGLESSQVLEGKEEPTQPIESHRLLHRAMAQIRSEFSERSWNAFWGSVVDRRPTRELAEELGISTAGIRQAKRRVLRRLRLQLGDID